MRSFFAFERDVGWCETLGGKSRNSPRSGCREHAVGADGNSRYRVKMYWRLRASVMDEEEWYRGRLHMECNAFVSLNQQRGEGVFLLVLRETVTEKEDFYEKNQCN